MNRRPSGPHSLLFEVEGPRADKPAKGQALRRVYDVSKRKRIDVPREAARPRNFRATISGTSETAETGMSGDSSVLRFDRRGKQSSAWGYRFVFSPKSENRHPFHT
jgi:hypothetical protein